VLPASAQKKKKVVAKKTTKVEAPVENPRFTEMLSATQRVTFIDSVVISRDQLLDAFHTNAEEGRLSTYKDFFHAPGQASDIVYVNELGNKCIFSMNNGNGGMRLYSCDLLANEWSTPEPLKGLEEEGLTDMGFPYMMPDGQTFYFAARGGSGLGGYDIYYTRFDAENGRFMKPENIGLPFNSEADDFLYVISEQDSIGFFATSRRQPEGKVCVYTFVPSATRSAYDIDAIGGTAIRSFANIAQISDTWGNNRQRTAALQRLERLRSASDMTRQKSSESKGNFTFIVDDKTVCRSFSDFRDPDNASRMRELLSMQKLYDSVSAKLLKDRNDYTSASILDRNRLYNEILQLEEQQHQLAQQIQFLEKEIRNNELSN
jgi:hypothetical protein